MILFLFSLVSNSLTKYGRRHFILFTNYHVSWDTLYITQATKKEEAVTPAQLGAWKLMGFRICLIKAFSHKP